MKTRIFRGGEVWVAQRPNPLRKATERGGLVEFVSAELRYAFFARQRVHSTQSSARAEMSMIMSHGRSVDESTGS